MATTRVNVNGTVKSTKPRAASKPKVDHLHRYCNSLVVFFAVGSATLNALHGYKASVAAACLLATLPLVVWTLGQIAAKLYKRHTKLERKLSMMIAGIALAGLVLSLVDVVQAIKELTHMNLWRAIAIGIVIDLGMVGCETVAALTKAAK